MKRNQLNILLVVYFAIIATPFVGREDRSIRAAWAEESVSSAAPSYYRDVRPIVAEHCVSCHQPGRSAPFSLTTYHDVQKRSAQISELVKAHMMPPWKPDSHGEFIGENRLTVREIAVLQMWSDHGAEQGIPISAAKPIRNVDGVLGTPDAVLKPTVSCAIPADGVDVYRCFILPTNFSADRYLAAIVFQPGNPAVADHALEYVDRRHTVRFRNQVAPGESFAVRNAMAGLDPSTVIGGWGISTPSTRFPARSGILLPKGADVVVQVHYHPTGKPETDSPRVLLYFCRGPVTRPVRVAPVLARNLRLIPGRSDVVAGGQAPVRSNISILSVIPYLHRRGAAVNLSVLLPDRSTRSILGIPQWDLDWVGDYRFRRAVRVPAGSLLIMDAAFSNAPGAGGGVVTWGDSAEDENAVVYVFYTTDRGPAGVPFVGSPRQAAMGRILLRMFDTNRNGAIDRTESIQMRQYFRGSMPSMAGMEM